MRTARRILTSLPIGLVAASLASVAQASPRRVVVDDGPFTDVAGDVEQAARSLVSARTPATFGDARSLTMSSGSRVVRMPQMHHGVPVAAAGATVAFGAAGAPRRVSLSLVDELPDDVTPTLDAAAAAAAAGAFIGYEVPASRAMLAIWPTAGEARLAWIVYPKPVASLAHAPLVVIDAETGQRLAAFDAAVAVNQAQVYPTNPVKSPSLATVTLDVGAGKTTLENDLVVSHNCIDKHTTKTIFNFTVHTCELDQTALPDANGDYLIAPGTDTEAEDAFSEVSMFHHANRAYTMFRGFSPTFQVQPTALDTVSNLRLPAGYQTFDLAKMSDPDLPLEPFQNAFFAPADPIFGQVFGLSGAAMWFGQGPKKDYSYDGDVIYHEFSHAVVNATIALVGTAHADELGLSVSPGGMNEGLADYFSSALAGDPDVGEYAVQDFGGAGAIRSLTNPDKCPADLGGEVHQDATLFSGALWDVRATLDATDAVALDLAVFEALVAAPSGDVGYEDVAEQIIASVKASPLGSAAADALTQAFTKRGVLPKCNRVLEYGGAPVMGPGNLGGNLFSLGLSIANVGNGAPYAPGIVQVHQALENVATVSVSFDGQDVGGGAMLGQQGTPFTPKLLVRFAADPITFTYKPLTAVDGTQVLDLAEAQGNYSVTVDAPPGATDVYVMVVNSGDGDGAYKKLSITTTTLPDGTGGGSTSSSSSSSSGSAPTPANAGSDSSADSGCGCRVGGDDGDGAAAAALAALALVVARRRRRAS